MREYRFEPAPARVAAVVSEPVLACVTQVREEAPNEQRDVDAEAAAVGVDLVEHDEAAAMVGEEHVSARRPRASVGHGPRVGEGDPPKAQRVGLRARSSITHQPAAR